MTILDNRIRIYRIPRYTVKSIHLIIPIDYKRHYNIVTFTNKTI